MPWGEPEARTLILQRAAALPDGAVEVLLVLLNADSAAQEFVLPLPSLTWTVLLDSAQPSQPELPLEADRLPVAAYAVALLVARLP